MPPATSTRPTIRFWPTSTPTVRAPRFRRSSSITLTRHRQQLSLRQGDLFTQATICDYLFDG